MELNRNLLFEVFRYEPSILCTMSVINKYYHQKINDDVSYIQYLLEDVYSLKNSRSLSLTECSTMIRLKSNPSQNLYAFEEESRVFITYNVAKGVKESIKLQTDELFRQGTWLTFIPEQMAVIATGGKLSKQCFSI